MEIFRFQRAHYRIQYPEAVRPAFILEGESSASPVVDCCEQGLRYQPRGCAAPPTGAPARGVIRFRTGDEVPVSGTVVRIQDREVAIHLTEAAIPWRVMLKEQLFLRRTHPLCA